MKLINPTDDQLDAAVAEHVAGWKRLPPPYGPDGVMSWTNPNNPYAHNFCTLHTDGAMVSHGNGLWPHFTRSMDAVLPLMEKFSHDDGEKHGGEPVVFRFYSPACSDDVWGVRPVWLHHDGEIEESTVMDKSLPRACCVALLRAHGVEVKFST